MRNFKDESFVGQFLSPKLMRDFRLFAIVDDEKQNRRSRSRRSTTTAATGSCARRCRASTTSTSASPTSRSGASTCAATARSRCATPSTTTRPLHDDAQEVLKHVGRLWGFDVHLESVDGSGLVKKRWSVPASAV